MDARRWAGVGLAWSAALSGCTKAPAPPPAPEDRLVLELGGPGEPLGAVLRAQREHGARRASETERREVVRPPTPAPAPAERIVRLRAGQTIYGLAREHLGAAARYREILERNGWSEQQAARLPTGTPVKLPR